jgi:hypothetical protein
MDRDLLLALQVRPDGGWEGNLAENISVTGYFVACNPGARQWDIALIQASDRSNVPVYGDVTDFMASWRI